MTTYEVTVTRNENLWAAVISDLPPSVIGTTDVEHFGELETEVRDLIAGLTESGPDSFDLDWRFEIRGRDVTDAIVQLAQAEDGLRRAAQARDKARARALDVLHGTGLSQAVIGDVLGLSHQRIHQLLRAG